jgi:hypothetical protein
VDEELDICKNQIDEDILKVLAANKNKLKRKKLRAEFRLGSSLETDREENENSMIISTWTKKLAVCENQVDEEIVKVC